MQWEYSQSHEECRGVNTDFTVSWANKRALSMISIHSIYVNISINDIFLGSAPIYFVY